MATEMSAFLRKKIESFSVKPVVYDYGTVSRVGDGVARVVGLPGRRYGELLEFEVSGEKIESVYMLPGWTHSIENLSDTEDLVTVMTCSEVFDPAHPDTFFEPV